MRLRMTRMISAAELWCDVHLEVELAKIFSFAIVDKFSVVAML